MQSDTSSSTAPRPATDAAHFATLVLLPLVCSDTPQTALIA